MRRALALVATAAALAGCARAPRQANLVIVLVDTLGYAQ
jgi:hypothetical protein